MKQCIVCKRPHDKQDLFCDDHADIPNSEKIRWYNEYNYLINNAQSVADLEKYSLIVMIPKKNENGEFDKDLSRIIVNGSTMQLNPPVYIKIDEKMYVDMKLTF